MIITTENDKHTRREALLVNRQQHHQDWLGPLKRNNGILWLTKCLNKETREGEGCCLTYSTMQYHINDERNGRKILFYATPPAETSSSVVV